MNNIELFYDLYSIQEPWLLVFFRCCFFSGMNDLEHRSYYIFCFAFAVNRLSPFRQRVLVIWILPAEWYIITCNFYQTNETYVHGYILFITYMWREQQQKLFANVYFVCANTWHT